MKSDSKNYGVYLLLTINEFNSDFYFNDDSSGIFSLVSEKMDNEMILDFYEEDNSEYLEIELYGKQWSSIEID